MAPEKLQVLHALDVAETQRYHFRAVLIAGTGFFADAYDLFCITLVTKLLGRIYYHDAPGDPGRLPLRLEAAIAGVTFCGAIAGQLLFGWLGDRAGRKRFYGATVLLMAAGSFLSGLSFGNSTGGVIATLCFFRFWLGVGIGGDYPLSATIVAEYASKRARGGLVAAVFAMEGFGVLAGCVVTLAVSATLQARSAGPALPEADYAWRVVLMAGAVPACLTYHWRMRMPETARYTALVAGDAAKAARDMSRVLQVDDVAADGTTMGGGRDKDYYGVLSRRFARRHGVHLVGATACWFVLGAVVYSHTILQEVVFRDARWVPKSRDMSALEEAYRIGRAHAIMALCGALPGYWLAIALVDVVGRKPIQLFGFAMMMGFTLAIAALYDGLTSPGRRPWLVAMCAFTFFFASFGPATTTFVVAAEIFPAHLRATCHGLAAAAGKAGAIAGTFGFMYAARRADDGGSEETSGIGVRASLFVLGAANVLGMLFTCLLPEPKGRSLEEVSCHGAELLLDRDDADVGDSQVLPL
ncbi:unnamed protein product [Urochloa decumbens]|uniref:H(+)/Pi cotransporter n=1 Tax=Urochloa decumbens TaxID=240449 RepID=A0ABC9ECX6_9POAL